MSAKIFIIDDHPIFRFGLAALLRSEGDLEVLGEAESLREAVTDARVAKADLVMVDLSLKDGSGLDLIKRLTQQHRGLRMLAVSMHDEGLFAERALRAGAVGYVMKDTPHEQLVSAIRQALRGEMVLSPSMTQRVVRRAMSGGTGQPVSPLTLLTDRELEVFDLLGRGRATREVAKALGISIKTVETHQANIKSKLGIRSANELIRAAVTWELER